MSATRSRAEEKTYKRYLRTVDPAKCVFCPITDSSDEFVEQTQYFKVIRNIFAYSIWDGQRVSDHLLVAPLTHTDSLANMTTEQKIEFVDLVERYEKLGYNVYARAPQSVIKSIPHQHTHLIKTEGAPKRLIFLLRRPYFRLVR